MEYEQNCAVITESDTKMEQKITPTSLLTLNEYCLLDIFQFLKLADFVNLDKTCAQLKFIGARVCAQKYKKIEVSTDYKRGMKDKDFADILSVIGEHILSVSLNDVNQTILQLIEDNCKNIHSLELWNCEMPIELQRFDNLKELKLSAVKMSTNELKACFARNAGIECLEYGCSYGEDVLELLHMLHKLKTLHLDNISNNLHQNQHLRALDGLTKFSFYSSDNCNPLLTKLTKNLNLIELRVCMPLDADTFGIIQSFRSLKNLALHQLGLFESLPENTVFPTTLKCLKFTGVKMCCKTLRSTVKQLKSLNEFDLGYRDDLDKALDLNDKKVIRQIAMELNAELTRRNRPLNITYYDWQVPNKQRCIYNSPLLNIESSYAADKRSEMQRIIVMSV